MPRVVKSSWLPAKITAYLVSISWLLCLAFLYRWHFLNKISLEWPLTLTTQPSTWKLSDNAEYLLLFLWFSLLLGLKICKETSQGPYDFFYFSLIQLLLYLQEFSQKMISQTHEIETQVDGLVNSTKVSQQATKSLMTRVEMTEITGQINKRNKILQ